MPEVTSKDGTAIAFDKAGAGPALILVDGAMCSRAFGPMPGLAQRLTLHFTVFTYDRRGRNESGDTPPYAVEREIDDIEALINETGGSAFVYGISSGAVLALDATKKFPNKVKKLAVYEPPIILDGSRPSLPDSYVNGLREAIGQGRPGDAVVLFMTLVGVPGEAIEGMKHAPVWPVMESIAPTLSYDAAILVGDQPGQPLKASKWASITVPTLAMYGGASPEFFGQAINTIADTLPNAQSKVLPDQTHEVDPDVIAPVLIEFFKA